MNHFLLHSPTSESGITSTGFLRELYAFSVTVIPPDEKMIIYDPDMLTRKTIRYTMDMNLTTSFPYLSKQLAYKNIYDVRR
jgi:hypothetical protein